MARLRGAPGIVNVLEHVNVLEYAPRILGAQVLGALRCAFGRALKGMRLLEGRVCTLCSDILV